MNNYTTELFEARVERTIDPKLWASVSSGCSKTYKSDLGNSARVPSGTMDQLLARYVAGLIILKQTCPETITDLQNSPAFKPWAQKLVQMGVTIDQVHQLYNQNCGKLPMAGNGTTGAVQTPQPATIPQPVAPQKPATVTIDDEDDFQLGDINLDSNGRKIPVQRRERYISNIPDSFDVEEDDEEEEANVPEPVEEPVIDDEPDAEVEVYDRNTGERIEADEIEDEPEDDEIAYGDSFDDEDEEAQDDVPDFNADDEDIVPDEEEDTIDYSTDIEDKVADTPEDEIDFNEDPEAEPEPEIEDAVIDEPGAEIEDEVIDEPVANDRPGVIDYPTNAADMMPAVHQCLIRDNKRVFADLHGCSDADECMIPVSDLTRGTGINDCENRDEAIAEMQKPGAQCYKMKVFNGDPEEVKGDVLWNEAPVDTEYYVITNDEGARIYYKEANGDFSLTWVGDLAEFGFRI